MRTNIQGTESFNRLFWSKVLRYGVKDCWPWTGSTVNEIKPYGRIKVSGKLKLTHRVAYELVYKILVPDNIQVLHKCDNPICCNPNHLHLGTNADNMHEKSIRGRINTKGGPQGKFTYDEWQDIKNLYYTEHWSKCRIASKYNTYDTTIRRVIMDKEGYRYKGKVL